MKRKEQKKWQKVLQSIVKWLELLKITQTHRGQNEWSENKMITKERLA